RKLAATGITTATLHSNRSQNQRLAALKAFKSGAVRVLVATDIAARGIDVEGISHVVNFDFPPQPEDYVHRIGRTGRAAAVGDAISFVTPDDAAALRALERFIARGIPREKAGDFDYTDDEPVTAPALRPQFQRPQRPQRGEQGQRPHSSRPQSSRPQSHSSPQVRRRGAGATPSTPSPSAGAGRKSRRRW
ncbi:MAG TPA: helicase-related protein, partial [Thermoanaerobaculia bacterium]